MDLVRHLHCLFYDGAGPDALLQDEQLAEVLVLPGCFSALFVMLPLGIYFLVQLAATETFPSYCWWAPICAFPVVAFLTILLPIISFRRKDTPYAFAKYQDDEFEVRHGIASLFRKEK